MTGTYDNVTTTRLIKTVFILYVVAADFTKISQKGNLIIAIISTICLLCGAKSCKAYSNIMTVPVCYSLKLAYIASYVIVNGI